jgi:hypothetical protein
MSLFSLQFIGFPPMLSEPAVAVNGNHIKVWQELRKKWVCSIILASQAGPKGSAKEFQNRESFMIFSPRYLILPGLALAALVAAPVQAAEFYKGK